MTDRQTDDMRKTICLPTLPGGDIIIYNSSCYNVIFVFITNSYGRLGYFFANEAETPFISLQMKQKYHLQTLSNV